MTENTAIYYVDFNAVDPETWHVRGSRQWTESPIAINIDHYVLLKDDEGNTCYAWVTEFGEDAIAFELDRSTWKSYQETTGAVVLEPGRYVWKVDVDNKTRSRAPFRVIDATQMR